MYHGRACTYTESPHLAPCLLIPCFVRSTDLWALATAQLNDEDRHNIGFGRPDKLKALADLHTLTEKSKQECIKKRWKYTRKSGEAVILRDVLDKIIRSIDIFKQVGDAAVQYDPVHAALPWAGIRFVLEVREHGAIERESC
jgi:hypothetical protein